jgi:hypothetical protein
VLSASFSCVGYLNYPSRFSQQTPAAATSTSAEAHYVASRTALHSYQREQHTIRVYVLFMSRMHACVSLALRVKRFRVLKHRCGRLDSIAKLSTTLADAAATHRMLVVCAICNPVNNTSRSQSHIHDVHIHVRVTSRAEVRRTRLCKRANERECDDPPE